VESLSFEHPDKFNERTLAHAPRPMSDRIRASVGAQNPELRSTSTQNISGSPVTASLNARDTHVSLGAVGTAPPASRTTRARISCNTSIGSDAMDVLDAEDVRR
jgi:hypothetical protein